MESQPPLMARLPLNSGGLLPGKVPLCSFLLEQQRLLKASGYRAASCHKESLGWWGSISSTLWVFSFFKKDGCFCAEEKMFTFFFPLPT